MGLLLASYLNSAGPLLTNDSGGYLPTGELFTDYSREGSPVIPGWGGVSFLGDAHRTWPPSLFYGVVPESLGNVGRGWLQLLCVGLATVLFARAATRWFPRRSAALAQAIIYVIALSGAALSLNFTIGAEAPLFIFATVACASLLTGLWRLGRALLDWRTWTYLFVSWWFALFVALTRPTGLFFFLGISASIALTIWWYRRTVGMRPLVLLSALAVITVGACVYTSTISSRQSATWAQAPEVGSVPYRAVQLVFALSPGMNPEFSAPLRGALPADAPRCLREVSAEVVDWQGVLDVLEECGERGQAWIQSNFTSVYLRYWLTNPVSAATWAVRGSAYAWDGNADPTVRSPVPAVIRTTVFSSPPNTNVSLIAAVLWLVAIGLSIRLKLRHSHSAAARTSLVLVLLSGATWISFIVSYMDVWGSWARKAWPFNFLLIVLTLLALAVVVTGLRDSQHTVR